MRAEAKRSAAVCFLFALVTYLITLAPDLVWYHFGGDGGELITASVTLGVPHPTGYPTYVLLGRLFGLLPVGTIAYRFHLFSAVSMSAAAGFVTYITAMLQDRGNLDERRDGNLTALACGLTFAFAPLIWGQATIAEVYALNLFCLAALLWAVLLGKPAWLAGLLLGLSITTHMTSLLMVPITLKHTPRRNWLLLGLGSMVGLIPFYMIPVLAKGSSPVVWGDPTTLDRWWWLVSGRLYHSNLLGVSVSELASRASTWPQTLLPQFTWAAPFVVVFGLRSSSGNYLPSWKSLLITALLYLAYAATYNSVDAILFLLPAVLLFSILLNQGLRRLGVLALLLPLTSLLLNFAEMNLSSSPGVRPAAEQLLNVAPQDAILMTPGDSTIFALWYFQEVERRRPDLFLVDANLFAFDWYRRRLQWLYPELGELEIDDLERFRHHNQQRHPFCFAAIGAAIEHSATLPVSLKSNEIKIHCNG